MGKENLNNVVWGVGNAKSITPDADILKTLNWLKKRTVNEAVLVETYKNGKTFYRKYSDGWVEQGGYIEITANETKTISLHKAYKDTTYTVIASIDRRTAAGSGHSSIGAMIKSTTSISLISDYNDGGGVSTTGAWWICYGYVNTQH